jgi:hypothetical protein
MSIKRRKSIPDPTVEASMEHAYEDDVKGGRHPMLQGQRLEVYQFIKLNSLCTREDVSRGLGLKASTATARIKELIDEGFVIEPPGVRKENRTGVRAKTLQVTDRAAGGTPLDRVRIEVVLAIDHSGNYHATAHVVGGVTTDAKTLPIQKKLITITAPHPDTYKASSSAKTVETVSRHELQSHADDIIDADYYTVNS